MKFLLATAILLASLGAHAQLLSVYQADRMSEVLASAEVQKYLHTSTTSQKILGLESIENDEGQVLVSKYRLKLEENNMVCTIDVDILRLAGDDVQVTLGKKSCL